MSQFSQKNMAGNIRSLLAINSTDLPKLQPIETLLWSAVQNALVNADDLIVELEWLGLGAQLSNILKKSQCGGYRQVIRNGHLQLQIRDQRRELSHAFRTS